MKGKTILILGGGVGGIVTANALRERLPSEHNVVLVDKRSEHVFTPSLLWVMVGWRKPRQICKELARMLHSDIEFIQAEVQEIHPDTQNVKTTQGKLAYDYLVLALGADLAPQTLPGFSEAAHTPYNLDGATRLWEALQDFEGGRVAVLVSSMPFKCPAAPYETALLLDDYLRRRGIREQSELDVYTPEKLPMGVAGPQMGEAVVGMLEAGGIRFNPELNTSRIEVDQKSLHFTNQDVAQFDLLVGIPPHRAPEAIKQSPLANQAGWISVDKHTLQTQYTNVYAIGDVAAITLANGMALPKAGVFADGQGSIVAQRIAEDISGIGARAEFDGLGFCWIESGGGSAGFASGDFYAEPDPRVPLPRSGRLWHLGKILFEKYWLGEGLGREILRQGLNLANKVLGISAPI